MTVTRAEIRLVSELSPQVRNCATERTRAASELPFSLTEGMAGTEISLYYEVHVFTSTNPHLIPFLKTDADPAS